MATHQSEEWRRRYHDALKELETKENVWAEGLERLYRNCSRIAVAAYGRDPELDQCLDRVREAIRARADGKRLEQLVDEVHKTAARAEEGGATSETARFLTHLLNELTLPATLHPAAQALKTSLRGDPQGHALDDARSKIVALLQNALASAAEDLSGINEVLQQLLEKLSFPPEIHAELEMVKSRLEQPISPNEIDGVLRAITDLILGMRARVEEQHAETEGFLVAVTQRLQELDAYFEHSNSARSESTRERQELQGSVSAEVQGIRADVSGASELSQLKTALATRLDTLHGRVETFLLAEEARNRNAEQEVGRLGKQLRELELETDTLRGKLKHQRDQALRDALTDVFNRFAFEERATREVARWKRYQEPLSLLFWDIDHFKAINDNFGHQAGDKVLRAVAGVLRSNVRETDLVARYGGEEFVILMPNTAGDAALEVANKLRCILAETSFHYRDARVKVTASCGVAEFSGADTLETVMRRADDALYQAKHGGRNRCQLES
jgi:diguanylate cyclase